MQIYPQDPSFVIGSPITLCVEPSKQFALAFFLQGDEAVLDELWPLEASSSAGVSIRTSPYEFYVSGTSNSPTTYSVDWGWPSITFPTTSDWETGAYVIAAFEVDSLGRATDQIGQWIQAGEPVPPVPWYSDSMALIVGKCATPAMSNIAYVIPTATYHAYNWTGGGSFYPNKYQGTPPAKVVTLRRPGGGLGAQLGEPDDPYDPASPRQQFAHWDAKFIAWMKQADLGCDFYCDLDLAETDAAWPSLYQLIVSVGHQEYWSQEMWNNVSSFLGDGGNLAVFGGNTCFRPVGFGEDGADTWLTTMTLLADSWPGNAETGLIGLSYAFGGGWYGTWSDPAHDWVNTTRLPYGYSVLQADHWAFQGTGLANGQTFGAVDRLVGYEADGVKPGDSSVNILATSPLLSGWEFGGTARMVTKGPDSSGPYLRGVVFNCGTTDWARILGDPTLESYGDVNQITLNVLRKLSNRPD